MSSTWHRLTASAAAESPPGGVSERESSPHWCQTSSNHSETNRATHLDTVPHLPHLPHPLLCALFLSGLEKLLRGFWLIKAIECSLIKSNTCWTILFPSCFCWLRSFFFFLDFFVGLFRAVLTLHCELSALGKRGDSLGASCLYLSILSTRAA